MIELAQHYPANHKGEPPFPYLAEIVMPRKYKDTFCRVVVWGTITTSRRHCTVFEGRHPDGHRMGDRSTEWTIAKLKPLPRGTVCFIGAPK